MFFSTSLGYPSDKGGVVNKAKYIDRHIAGLPLGKRATVKTQN